ncbi:hypothetical protein HAPAU_29850 [Halalkalicoccus paucihalophilus]|uniref:DUF1616 domain-containing protein n=1 Tax=Halalkalicoccus paucihalophilus TaxID=1008153 RepID=A0A151ABA5_9EURY|nr:DUF1616 domain-containing protein [Halalkalicoccus paucihalophilus]KYH24893.1 hypothetical protein HAPAU_29850 [Halalkalicoccus paucihalophilus]
MGRERTLWLLLPRPLRQFPADLTAVVGITLLTILVATVPVIRETPLRIGFGLVFVLFVPGYALVAALFPEKGERAVEESDVDRSGESGIDGIERTALSFGLSIAVVPLIGLVLNFTPWGIRLVPILLSVGGFTVIAASVAAVRRWELPAEERFAVPYRQWAGATRTELFEPDTQVDAVLNVLLVCALLLAMSSVAYAVAVPQQGESFSEFYLLTENDEGELVADGYPTEFVAGEPQSLIVGIGNQEHEPTEYSVVVQLQEVERTGGANDTGGEVTVNNREQLDTFQTQLDHNETWRQEHEVTPQTTGEDLRLVYLLYNGDVPANPTEDNAYRSTHLWISVAESESAAADES